MKKFVHRFTFSHFSSAKSKLKIPGVCIDVDGVLKLGSKAIPGANEAIKLLRHFLIF